MRKMFQALGNSSTSHFLVIEHFGVDKFPFMDYIWMSRLKCHNIILPCNFWINNVRLESEAEYVTNVIICYYNHPIKIVK